MGGIGLDEAVLCANDDLLEAGSSSSLSITIGAEASVVVVVTVFVALICVKTVGSVWVNLVTARGLVDCTWWRRWRLSSHYWRQIADCIEILTVTFNISLLRSCYTHGTILFLCENFFSSNLPGIGLTIKNRRKLSFTRSRIHLCG